MGWRQRYDAGGPRLGLFALFVAATAVAESPGAVEHLLRGSAVAAAAVRCGRTRSVWVSTAVLAAFRLGLALVGYAEAVLGWPGRSRRPRCRASKTDAPL